MDSTMVRLCNLVSWLNIERLFRYLFDLNCNITLQVTRSRSYFANMSLMLFILFLRLVSFYSYVHLQDSLTKFLQENLEISY